MAAFTFRQSKSANGAGTAPSVTLDAAPTQGDLLVCAIRCGGNTTVSLAGWTQIGSTVVAGSGGTRDSAAYFYRIAPASMSAVVTGATSSGNWTIVVSEYNPGGGAVALAIGNLQVNASGTTQPTPTVSVPLGSQGKAGIVVCCAGDHSSASWTAATVNGSGTGVTLRSPATINGAGVIYDLFVTSLGASYSGSSTETLAGIGQGGCAVFTVASTAITRAVGSSSETDVAQTVGWNPKKRLITPAIETDAAQAIAKLKVKAVSSASETDAAQSITHRKIKVVGTAAETDSAQAATRRKVQPAGSASEQDFAQIVTPQLVHAAKYVTVGTASETDSAQSLVWAPKKRLTTTVVETDVSQPITRRKVRSVASASEQDFAQTVTPQLVHVAKYVAVGTASEIDSAQGVAWSPKKRLTATVVETDSAQAIVRRKVKTTGTAVETDLVQSIRAVKVRTVSTAAETDAAQLISKRKIKLVGSASEVDFANPISLRGKIIQTVQSAVETDVAQLIRWAPKRKIVSSVSEVDSAQTITHAKRKAIGVTFESDVAQPIIRQKIRTVVTVFETDTAQQVKVVKTYSVAVAVETDYAQPITRRVAGVLTVETAFETDVACPMYPRVTHIIHSRPLEPILVMNGAPIRVSSTVPIRSANGEPVLTHSTEPVLVS